MSKEDVKKIKQLFNEQEKEIESLVKQIEELKASHDKTKGEVTLARVEYTKQVRENEDTVKRYRKMIEDEKVFAITKFSKDLLEVRDAIRFALNNNDVEKMKQQVDLAALKENFASNLEG